MKKVRLIKLNCKTNQNSLFTKYKLSVYRTAEAIIYPVTGNTEREIVSREFESKGLHVVDGKFELGRLKYGDGKIVIIDEISPDVLRVCRGYSPDSKGDCTVYRQCAVTNFTDGRRTIKNRNQVTAADLIKIFI